MFLVPKNYPSRGPLRGLARVSPLETLSRSCSPEMHPERIIQGSSSAPLTQLLHWAVERASARRCRHCLGALPRTGPTDVGIRTVK